MVEHAFHVGMKRRMILYWGVRSLRDLYLPELPAGSGRREHSELHVRARCSRRRRRRTAGRDAPASCTRRSSPTFPTSPATRSTPAARSRWSRPRIRRSRRTGSRRTTASRTRSSSRRASTRRDADDADWSLGGASERGVRDDREARRLVVRLRPAGGLLRGVHGRRRLFLDVARLRAAAARATRWSSCRSSTPGSARKPAASARAEELAKLAPNMRAAEVCPRERVAGARRRSRWTASRCSPSSRHPPDCRATAPRRLPARRRAGRHAPLRRAARRHAAGSIRPRARAGACDLAPGRVLVIDFDAKEGGGCFAGSATAGGGHRVDAVIRAGPSVRHGQLGPPARPRARVVARVLTTGRSGVRPGLRTAPESDGGTSARLGFLLFWICAATGIWIYVGFDTSADRRPRARRSAVGERVAAGRLRAQPASLCADALVLVTLLHLAREWLAPPLRARSAASRGSPASSRCGSLFASGIGGFWLVWDQLAQWSLIATTEWFDALPVFDGALTRNVIAGDAGERPLLLAAHLPAHRPAARDARRDVGARAAREPGAHTRRGRSRGQLGARSPLLALAEPMARDAAGRPGACCPRAPARLVLPASRIRRWHARPRRAVAARRRLPS